MLLAPEEARFLGAVLDRAEFRGAEEVRAAARVSTRLRWLAAGAKGEDPGGADDLRRFCAQVVGEVLGGRLPIAGGWTAAVVALERRLAAPDAPAESAPEEPAESAPEEPAESAPEEPAENAPEVLLAEEEASEAA